MKKVFFAGSFNPFTKGHADITERLLNLFDHVIIGIGINISKPSSSEAAERNESRIKAWIKKAGLEDRCETTVYSGLTAEAAREMNACCLARGVRNSTDFNYESSLADINREAFGIDTVLIPADPSLSAISSTAIRDLEAHGRSDIAEKYLP